MQAAQKGPSRADSLRALSILERLASVQDQDPDGALMMQLSDALLPILATSTGAGRKRTRGDEAATLRVLGALAAIWSKATQSASSGGNPCTIYGCAFLYDSHVSHPSSKAEFVYNSICGYSLSIHQHVAESIPNIQEAFM